MDVEIYSSSPGPAVPPSPYQITVNRKEEEIRKLKKEYQSLAMNTADMELEMKQKNAELAKKDKIIWQLKQVRTSLKSEYEQEMEYLKSFEEKCRIQETEIKKLQQNALELDLHKKTIENLENEKEGILKDNENLMDKLASFKDYLIENNCLRSLVDDQKLKMEEFGSLINEKNSNIDELCKMKEHYESRIQLLQCQCVENVELLEQNGFFPLSKLDTSGEILSVVCSEKQIEELKAELNQMRDSHQLEMEGIKREKEEEISKLEKKMREMELRRKFDLDSLDRFVQVCNETSKQVENELNRCKSTFWTLNLKFVNFEEFCIGRVKHLELQNNIKTERVKLNQQEITKYKNKSSKLSRVLEELEKLNEKLQVENEKERKIFSQLKNEKENEMESLKEEKDKLENDLMIKTEFLNEISTKIDSALEENEKIRSHAINELKLVEEKLKLFETKVNELEKNEIDNKRTINNLKENVKNENSKCEILKNELENSEKRKNVEIENLKCDLIAKNKLIDENQRKFESLEIRLNSELENLEKQKNMQISGLFNELNQIRIENEQLKSDLTNKKEFFNRISTKIEIIENERTNLIIELKSIELMRNQTLQLEETVKNVEESSKNLINENEKMQMELNEKEVLVTQLMNEKGKIRQEMDELELKLNCTISDKMELERENDELILNCSEQEKKISSLVLEANKLRSENHQLGLNHELEMSEKLEIYRELWESEKNKRKLEYDETEKLKTNFAERLKQEEIKCNLLRQNIMKLMEEKQDKHKADSIILEMNEKVELYKHHYEDQKEKLSNYTDLLLEEKRNNSLLKSKINALEREMDELKLEKQTFSPILPTKTRSVFSKCALHSTEIDLSSKLGSLDDSLKMSSYQSGDDKMEKKKLQQFKFYMNEEEEDDAWDLKYVKQLKSGNCQIHSDGRLTELQRRNTLCLPHLKTTYPVETQMCGEIPFEEDAFKKGKAVLEDFKIPWNENDYNYHRQMSPKPKVYRKPPQPTPIKNKNKNKTIKPKTPSSLKRIFGSRRFFKPRQPIAFNVGFSPVKSRGKIVISPKDEEKTPGFMRNKLKIFSKLHNEKKLDEIILHNF